MAHQPAPTARKQKPTAVAGRPAQAVAEVAAPRILLRTDVARDGVRLIMQDNGPGFPKAMMGRAIEPYVTTKSKGTGLGLAIVKKIVEEHSGTIAILNLTTSGASVTITLPIAPAETAALRSNRQAGR